MSSWADPFRERLQLLTDLLPVVAREVPDFALIDLPHAAHLPGVRRKLQNLAQRSDAKREADYRQLAETLERIAKQGTP